MNHMCELKTMTGTGFGREHDAKLVHRLRHVLGATLLWARAVLSSFSYLVPLATNLVAS